MKFLTSIIFTLFFIQVSATNYYVSNQGSDKNDGLTSSRAWQSLARVESAARAGIIKAGDSILFKRNDSFTGTLHWTSLNGQVFPSGTASKPITFAGYGEGNKPIFYYPKENKMAAENRILFSFTGVNYIVIDGLNFTDSDTLNNKILPANCGVPIYLGSSEEATTNHCSIRNIDISLCGMGIVIIGDSNSVTNSKFTNFKNLKSTANTGGSTAYEDYGANAITITGSDNIISHNFISGAWAESLDFGWNGGAIEMFNTCNRNKIIYNKITDCGGVAEFGGAKKDAYAEDNLFAHNIITNCGTLTWCNLDGVFAMIVSNIQYFNNTIIEDNNSRFSGPKTGNGIISSAPRSLIKPDAELFAFNGKPQVETVFNLKDNYFNLSTGISISRKSNDKSKILHESNVYKLEGGGVTNYELNASETILQKNKLK